MRVRLRRELKETLSRVLGPLGFHSRAFTWNRRRLEFVAVVKVEWGKVDSKETYSFTINAGVCWIPAYETCWRKPLPSFVQVEDCTVRDRVARTSDGRERWWYSNEHSVEEMVDGAREVVETSAVPYVDRMQSLEAMEQSLSGLGPRGLWYPPDVMSLSLIRQHLGDLAGARRPLEDRLARKLTPGEWTSQMMAMLEALPKPSGKI